MKKQSLTFRFLLGYFFKIGRKIESNEPQIYYIHFKHAGALYRCIKGFQGAHRLPFVNQLVFAANPLSTIRNGQGNSQDGSGVGSSGCVHECAGDGDGAGEC